MVAPPAEGAPGRIPPTPIRQNAHFPSVRLVGELATGRGAHIPRRPARKMFRGDLPGGLPQPLQVQLWRGRWPGGSSAGGTERPPSGGGIPRSRGSNGHGQVQRGGGISGLNPRLGRSRFLPGGRRSVAGALRWRCDLLQGTLPVLEGTATLLEHPCTGLAGCVHGLSGRLTGGVHCLLHRRSGSIDGLPGGDTRGLDRIAGQVTGSGLCTGSGSRSGRIRRGGRHLIG